MTLNNLHIGYSAEVTSVGGEGALRQHFLDMGLIPGVEVTLVKYAPMGDPMELRLHGYALTLRVADAENIGIGEPYEKPRQNMVVEANDGKNAAGKDANHGIYHPGLGEGGKFHRHGDGDALPNNTVLTFALAGNQNCGKTTLFNQLTGANQHVGNFPGVTVDKKSGSIRGFRNTEVTDLPGIYSLSPYTSEEIVSRRFILNSHPRGIINIVDATNIERNLYLTMQLLELNVPMVIALNMMDEVQSNGGSVDVNAMEEMLGVPVVPISASKNEGIDELVEHVIHVAHFQERPIKDDFCPPEEHGGAVHRSLHAIMHLIEDHAKRADIPVRFAASKLIEGDSRIHAALQLSQNEQETLEHIILQLEEERGLDRSAAMADMRFAYIKRVSDKCVRKPQMSRQYLRSARMDKVLTGRWTALPVFLAIIMLIFWLTFNVIGAWGQDLLDELVGFVSDQIAAGMDQMDISPVVQSLVLDGICAGVGSVVSFVPIIVTLFFFLSILEDSGYMARIAFVTDSLLRKIGLSGRSIVPLLIGFGCTVPGVMASRTLPSERDRKMTILLTPFMSCTAKLPIYGFFIAAFFPHNGAWIMVGLYLLAIMVGIMMAMLTKSTFYRGEPVPFVMELPNYRMPGTVNVLRLMWDKAKDFLQRAFTVIFAATIVIWCLQSFDFHLEMVSDASESILAQAANVVAPVFSPLGFGDWRSTTALITGFMAKESVVSTLSVLFAGQNITEMMTTQGAASLLVFCLLYTPCVAAIAAIRRELGNKYAVGVVAGYCILAWLVAFVVGLLV